MQLIILGPPGVGKGTQSVLIAHKLGLIHLSTGDILRDAVARRTALGLKAKEVIESGRLVSDEIMIGIIRDVLTKDDMHKGFILDGFPRTVKQAEELDALLEELKYDKIRIVYLSVPKDKLVTRLTKRGRKDDNIETVLHRMEVYKKQTVPVREHYKNKGVIFEVNGEGSIEEINSKILDLLES